MNATELQATLDTKVARLRVIADGAKGQNREFTGAESTEGRALLAEITNLETDLKAIREGRAFSDKVTGLLDGADAAKAAETNGDTTGAKAFFAADRREIGRKVADAITDSGKKALVPSGSIDISQYIGLVGTLPKRAHFLAELVYDATALDSAVMEYLRQTVRTNNAGTVADGETKNTSVYSFIDAEQKAEVIAHISEGIPRRYLQDHADLHTYLQDEMLYGLALEVDDQIVNGDGISPNLPGVLTTDGVPDQSYVTSVPTTTRKAITRLDVLGVVPNAWAINPDDWEALDLLTDQSDKLLSGGTFLDVADRRLWGVPVVLTTAVVAGTAILADWNGAKLKQRGGVELAWSETSNSTDFSKNLIRLRAEGRWAFAVTKPQNFVVVTLTGS